MVGRASMAPSSSISEDVSMENTVRRRLVLLRTSRCCFAISGSRTLFVVTKSTSAMTTGSIRDDTFNEPICVLPARQEIQCGKIDQTILKATERQFQDRVGHRAVVAGPARK